MESLTENDDNFENFLEISMILNIFLTIGFTLIGLVGNFITLLVYSQSKNRLNSSNIFIFCLAIFESLFLIIHFFEDTIRTMKNVTYMLSLNETISFDFIEQLNIVDRNFLICSITNYLRYAIRFIQAYIVVAFTVQRFLIVYFPLKNNFKEKIFAWRITFIIIFVSMTLNLWALFSFKTDDGIQKCDIDINWLDSYYTISLMYIILSMLVPMLIILVFNSLIIAKTFENDKTRKDLQISLNKTHETKIKTKNSIDYKTNRRDAIKYSYIKKINKKENQSKKMTVALLVASFSYVFLNLPYFITWFMFFSSFSSHNFNKNLIFAVLQIAEIFYILNYSINFFYYSLSGTLFRSQLVCKCKCKCRSNSFIV